MPTVLERGEKREHFELYKEGLLTGHLADLQNWRLTSGIHSFAMFVAKSPPQGLYHMYILLGREEIASILVATCECAAG